LGDPDNASLISLGNGLLEFADGAGVPDPVRTKLHEDILQSIAAEGRGLLAVPRLLRSPGG
jgi:hypothetical protein